MRRSTHEQLRSDALGASRAITDRAIDEARREGARAERESMARDAKSRVQDAIDIAQENRTYDPQTRSFLAEGGRPWHTLGTLGMTRLIGYSEEAQRVGEAVDVLIQFGIEQEIARRERLAEESRNHLQRDARIIDGMADGTSSNATDCAPEGQATEGGIDG